MLQGHFWSLSPSLIIQNKGDRATHNWKPTGSPELHVPTLWIFTQPHEMGTVTPFYTVGCRLGGVGWPVNSGPRLEAGPRDLSAQASCWTCESMGDRRAPTSDGHSFWMLPGACVCLQESARGGCAATREWDACSLEHIWVPWRAPCHK